MNVYLHALLVRKSELRCDYDALCSCWCLFNAMLCVQLDHTQTKKASIYTTKMDTYWYPPKWYLSNGSLKLRSRPEIDSYFMQNMEDTPSTVLSGTRELFSFGSPFTVCADSKVKFPERGIHGANINDVAAIVDQMVQHWPVFPIAAFRYTTRSRESDVVGTVLIDSLRCVRKKYRSVELQQIQALLPKQVPMNDLAQRPKRARTSTVKAAAQREGKRRTDLPQRILDSEDAVNGMLSLAAAGVERVGQKQKRRKVALEANLEPSDDEYNDFDDGDRPNLRALTAAAHPSELSSAPLSLDERSLLEMWYKNGGRIENEYSDDNLFEVAAALVPEPPLLPGQPEYTYADNLERIMRWYKTKPAWLKKHGLEGDGLAYMLPGFESSESLDIVAQ